MDRASGLFLDEMNARSAISQVSADQSPANRSVAEYTRALMPYNGNSASKSMKMVKEIIDNADENTQSWHFFNRAASDFNKPGISTEAKMRGLAQCEAILEKMGYKVENQSPDKFDISSIWILNSKENTRMTFGEFAELAREKDTLSKELNRRVGLAQDAAIMAQDKKAILFDSNRQNQRLAAAKLLSMTNKNVRRDDTDEAGGTGDERETDAKNDAKAEIQVGKNFMKDYNLGGAVETIWRNTKDNKYIKNRDDVARIFGIGYQMAESVFDDTGDYKKAQEAFETTLSKYKIPDSYIPNVFGDFGLKQEKKKLEEDSKVLLQKYNSADGSKKYITNYDAKSMPFVEWNPPSEKELNEAKRRRNAERINEIDSILGKKRKERQEEMKRRDERRKKFNQRKI